MLRNKKSENIFADFGICKVFREHRDILLQDIRFPNESVFFLNSPKYHIASLTLYMCVRANVRAHACARASVENTYKEVTCVVFTIIIEILNANIFPWRIGLPHLFIFKVDNLAKFIVAVTTVAPPPVARLRTN